MKRLIFIITICLISLNILSFSQLMAAELSTGSTIYVPIYRIFYHGYSSSKDAYGLTVTVCLRNTDPKQVIVVNTIEHYDSNGKFIQKLLIEPITIKPWSSKELSLLPESHPEDFGANLIVRWKSDKPANALLVEVMMVGQILNRGASFLTQGHEIKE